MRGVRTRLGVSTVGRVCLRYEFVCCVCVCDLRSLIQFSCDYCSHLYAECECAEFVRDSAGRLERRRLKPAAVGAIVGRAALLLFDGRKRSAQRVLLTVGEERTRASQKEKKRVCEN